MEEIETVEAIGQRGARSTAEAIEAFWTAAAWLAQPDSFNAEIDPAADAARALLDLASNGEEPALRTILTPDPTIDHEPDHEAWTVACFEIGNIAPAEVHTFDQACEALASLTNCGDESHVASELICTGGPELHWVAAVHSDFRFIFQFPDGGNLSAPVPAAATRAIARWHDVATAKVDGIAATHPDESDVIDLTTTDRHRATGPLAESTSSARPALSVAPPLTDLAPPEVGPTRAFGESRSLLRWFRLLTTSASSRRRTHRGVSDAAVADRQEQLERRIDLQAREIERLTQEVAELRTELARSSERSRRLHTGTE